MPLDVYQRVAEALDPTLMANRLSLELYDWQLPGVGSHVRRLALLCARQSGKSTLVALKSWHTAKYQPGSLILIVAPSRDQSKELMLKIDSLVQADEDAIEMETDSVFEKIFANGSRIVALPGSERSVRGYSGPRIIIMEEAARVPDETYRAARPMMVGADTEIIMISTAFGKRGFFYEAWASDSLFGAHVPWRKIFVIPKVDIVGGKLVERPRLPSFPGVESYFSERHDLAFMQEEFDTIGEFWFRQEYLCEFLDAATGLFSEELIRRSFDADVTPLFSGRSAMIDDEVEELVL